MNGGLDLNFEKGATANKMQPPSTREEHSSDL